MMVAQASPSPDRFEMRCRKAAAKKEIMDQKTMKMDEITQLEAPAASGSSRYDPSSDNFRSLIVTNTLVGDLYLSLPTTLDSPLFYVRNSTFLPGVTDVKLQSSSISGPIIGEMKFGWSTNNTVGIGDPQKSTDIQWENCKRVSTWSHATYEFQFGDGEDRRSYTWQRTMQRIFSDQPNMELRENLISGGMGERLAIYKGSQGLMWKNRGTFWIARELDKRRIGELGWAGASGGAWSEFELMVLLTGLGIIESSRRRARARRSA